MATTAFTATVTPPAPPGYLRRLWRVAAAAFVASIGVAALENLLQRAVSHDATSAYAEQAATIDDPVWSAVESVWPFATAAVVFALLMRHWDPAPQDATRLRLAPLAAVLGVAVVLGSFGGPPGAVVGVGLLPLLALAYLLPRLPREPRRRSRVLPAVALALALVVMPLAAGVLLPVEAGGVGCGSVPCRIGTDGTTELGIGLRNQGRLDMTITAISATGLPDRARALEFRYDDGKPVDLPVVVSPDDQLWLDSRVLVSRSVCRAGPLATGAEVRYRVLGITKTTRLEPADGWQRGLACTAPR